MTVERFNINGKTGTMAPLGGGLFKFRFDDGTSLIAFDESATAEDSLRITAEDEFNEELHPRDDRGRFGSGSGTSPLHKTDSKIVAEAKSVYTSNGAAEKYAKLPGTDGGRKIDIDKARELDPNYNADPSRVAGLHHDQVAAFADKMFEERMSMPVTSENEHVVFLAGGGGSGKSTIRDEFALDHGAHTLWDGTMSHYESSKEKIDRVLDSRRLVVYDVVLCPVENAVRNAIIRANETGRVVGVDILARAHSGSTSTALKLMDQYAGDKRVVFRVFMNAGKVKDVHEVTPPPRTLPEHIVRDFSHGTTIREKTINTYRDIAERGYETKQGKIEQLKPRVKDTLEASFRRLEGRGSQDSLSQDSGSIEGWSEKIWSGLSITADETHEHYAGEFASTRIGGKNISEMTPDQKKQAVLKAKKILQPAMAAKKSDAEKYAAAKLLSVTGHAPTGIMKSGGVKIPSSKTTTTKAQKLSITKPDPSTTKSESAKVYLFGKKVGDMTTTELQHYGLKAAKILQPASKANPEQKEAAAKFLMVSHQAMQKHIDAYPHLAAKYGAVAQKGKSGTNKGKSYGTENLGIHESTESSAPKEHFTYPLHNLSNDEIYAIKVYTSSGYQSINECLRGSGLKNASDEMKNNIKALDSAIDKHEIPKDVTIYRGISKSSFKDWFGGHVQEGTIVKDNGFISTSTSKGFAEGWKSGCTIHIDVPKGTKGMNVEKISSYGSHEHEIILPRGSKFEVVSVHPSYGGNPPVVKVKYVK